MRPRPASRACHVSFSIVRARSIEKTISGVPWWNDINPRLGATFDLNQPGPAIEANYSAGNALIAPSMGRHVAGGRRSATVPLMEPNQEVEGRHQQLDLRVSKTSTTGRGRMRANLDLYNALNASTILERNKPYGSRWGQPDLILDGRLLQLSGDISR